MQRQESLSPLRRRLFSPSAGGGSKLHVAHNVSVLLDVRAHLRYVGEVLPSDGVRECLSDSDLSLHLLKFTIYQYSPFQVLCPTRNFFSQNFPNCELLSGAGTGRPARTAGFQVSRAGAFRRVPVSNKYLQWLQAGRARSVPLYGRHRVFVEGGIPMPQVPSGRQGVVSSCRIRLRSTIRSSASS